MADRISIVVYHKDLDRLDQLRQKELDAVYTTYSDTNQLAWFATESKGGAPERKVNTAILAHKKLAIVIELFGGKHVLGGADTVSR